MQHDLITPFMLGFEGQEITPTLVSNVSGIDHNCLLRCFGFFNSNLKEVDKARSRQDYMSYLQIKAKRSQEFERYIVDGLSSDVEETVQQMTSAADYLTYLSDPQNMIPYGCLDKMGQVAGLSVGLAYISNVNLRIYTVDHGLNTEVLSWDHPDEEVASNPGRTLHIIHGRAHYQLMTCTLDRESIKKYSDYAKHNAWITWQNNKDLDIKSEEYIRRMDMGEAASN